MHANYEYALLFERNMGVLSERDQERLREAKVAMVGIGGVGGTLAVILARCGISNFLLIDHEKYEPTNMNRQIGCFVDTIGEYKVDVIKREIERINPYAQVETVKTKLGHDELRKLLLEWGPDVVASEADDLAYSAKVHWTCRELGIFSVSAMPSGMVGYVMCFNPEKGEKWVSPEALFGLPENLTYEELYELIESPENKCGRRWYIYRGKWRVDWFERWRRGEATITQLCPVVWLCASLAAVEILKYLVGKWNLIEAPRVWCIEAADGSVRVKKYGEGRLFNKLALRAFSIKLLGIGNRWRRIALKIFEWQLSRYKKIEEEIDRRGEETAKRRKTFRERLKRTLEQKPSVPVT